MTTKNNSISFFSRSDDEKTDIYEKEDNLKDKDNAKKVFIKDNSPWSEKYRPSDFKHIVLDPINRKIFQNILDKKKFPHMLFYGPPGAGKTTSAENLIRKYQSLHHRVNKENIIHLNASDERGIEVIRTQIQQFVKSKNLFETGYKFVVLDEVDYMTKNAQQALKNLLQSCLDNVRFCLICNYISRIDEALQTEFVRMRFNQLPETKIISFLQKVNICEKLNANESVLISIQRHFNSDIRSMINYMQSNQHHIHDCRVITNDIWEKIIVMLKTKTKISVIVLKINEISLYYNIDRRNMIKNFLNYIIRNHSQYINSKFIDFVESIIHIQECKTEYFLNYFILKMMTLI